MKEGKSEPKPVLVDSMVIIEAVRTKCWNAISGGLDIESVEWVREEVRKKDPGRPGFVKVSDADVQRMTAIHKVSELERAGLALEYVNAPGLDFGERDLIAYALAHTDVDWRLCTADMAAIRACVKLGWSDRLCSLEELASWCGSVPKPPIFRHFAKKWLASERVKHILM